MDFKENFQPNNQNNGENTGVENGGFRKREYVAITVLLVILSALITFVLTYVLMAEKSQTEKDEIRLEYIEQANALGEFKSIAELYSSLPSELRNMEMYKKLAYIDYYYRTHYAGQIDEEKLVYMVANGYIAGAGDIFGAYYTSDELKTLEGDMQGQNVGIGVYVTSNTSDQSIRISYVMQDGPAYKAGLLPGDLITHVNGESVESLGYYVALDKVKGEEGTEVKLTYKRGNESFDILMVREKVVTQTVIAGKHQQDSSVGVIRIIEFNAETPTQFKNAVKTLMDGGCTSLVFDLRGNPGGLLNSVTEILDYLLPAGRIVSIRYAGEETGTPIDSDESGDEFTKLYGKNVKMAVLVNGYSASAAELFTSALKDHKMATVVGEKTFGKGCGQNVITLPDGSGLSFTTFLYDPPFSPNYNGVGITPDVEAHLSEEAMQKNLFDLPHSEDDQLKAALEVLK